MTRYNKFIVALVGVIYSAVQVFFGFEIPIGEANVASMIGPILVAFGVERIANAD